MIPDKEEKEMKAPTVLLIDDKKIELIIMELKNHKEIGIFLTPVIENIQSKHKKVYLERIKNPIDIRTINEKRHREAYNSSQEVFNDLMLIWYNCKRFNMKKTSYYESALKLEELTKELIQKYFPEIYDEWLKDYVNNNQEDTITDDDYYETKKKGKKPRRRIKKESDKDEIEESVKEEEEEVCINKKTKRKKKEVDKDMIEENNEKDSKCLGQKKSKEKTIKKKEVTSKRSCKSDIEKKKKRLSKRKNITKTFEDKTELDDDEMKENDDNESNINKDNNNIKDENSHEDENSNEDKQDKEKNINQEKKDEIDKEKDIIIDQEIKENEEEKKIKDENQKEDNDLDNNLEIKMDKEGSKANVSEEHDLTNNLLKEQSQETETEKDDDPHIDLENSKKEQQNKDEDNIQIDNDNEAQIELKDEANEKDQLIKSKDLKPKRRKDLKRIVTKEESEESIAKTKTPKKSQTICKPFSNLKQLPYKLSQYYKKNNQVLNKSEKTNTQNTNNGHDLKYKLAKTEETMKNQSNNLNTNIDIIMSNDEDSIINDIQMTSCIGNKIDLELLYEEEKIKIATILNSASEEALFKILLYVYGIDSNVDLVEEVKTDHIIIHFDQMSKEIFNQVKAYIYQVAGKS